MGLHISDYVSVSEVQAALDERDQRIAELQQAVIDLTSRANAPNAQHGRIAKLERRLAEQEASLRQALVALIDWAEVTQVPQAVRPKAA